jgi:hypothetical protein
LFVTDVLVVVVYCIDAMLLIVDGTMPLVMRYSFVVVTVIDALFCCSAMMMILLLLFIAFVLCLVLLIVDDACDADVL